jgi:NAD+ kinase
VHKTIKLESERDREKITGLNEIQVHTKLPIQAIRFSVIVDGREFTNLIGDGVIVATPFGSTGYYASTGGTPFQKGIGLSFNNLHNKNIASIVVSEDLKIHVKILRGPAWLLSDNYTKFFQLNTNDVSIIQKSASIAQFISVPFMTKN